jgi:hypothetical protein
MTRGQGKFLPSEVVDGLCFVNSTISWSNMEALFEIGATKFCE